MNKKVRIVRKAMILLVAVAIVCVGCGRTKYYGSSYSQGNGTGIGGEMSASQDGGWAEGAEKEAEPQTAEELFSEALELSAVEDVEANPSGSLTNAIMAATEIVILADNGDSCKVRITYPNVKDVFLEKASELSGELNAETVNGFYAELEQVVSGGELSMQEVTLQLPVETSEEGQRAIRWTVEAQSAMTGGLYDIYYEAMGQAE